MFNLFKKTQPQSAKTVREETAEKHAQTAADSESLQSNDKPKVHGEDGVCCGGCGGQ